MTPAKRLAISRKIRLLRHEGYPERQAIAIAYRMAGVPPLSKTKAKRDRSRPRGRKPLARWGRPLRKRLHRSSRDTSRPSSDTAWALVEKMLEGDEEALVVLADLIEEGVSAGKTKFVKVKSYYGGAGPKKDESFAAITPGRQITLFGVKDRYNPKKGGYYRQGYISRYKIGDMASYGSFNLVYFGTITSISDKRVMIQEDRGSNSKKHSLTIEKFANRNWSPDTVAEGSKRNREWMD